MSTLGNTPRNRLRRAIVSLMVGVFVATIGALGALAAPPANDECATALAVTPGGAGVATSNIEATSFPDDPVPSCTMGPGFGSVFFTFVASDTSALVRSDVGSTGPDADFAVYDVDQINTCDTQSWDEVGCNEDNTVTLARNAGTCIEGLTIGKTYKIMLKSFTAASSGDYTIQVGGPCGGGVSPVCGDNVIEGIEQCDDGNTNNGDGCSDICEIEVVVDSTPPVFTTVPADIFVNTDAGLATAVVVFATPTATDDSGDAPTVTLIAGLASGSQFPLGPTLVTFEAEDPSGNTDQASFTVTVTDNEDPVISVLGDIVAEATSAAGAVVDFPFGPSPAATDNVAVVSMTRIVGPASGSTFPIGVTQVTFEAQDAAGNSAQGSFNVTVADTTDPVVTVPADVSAEATAPLTPVDIGTATALDNIDGVITPTASPSGPFPVGQTVVTWTATDAAGNFAQAFQTVTVTDTTAPVIAVPSDIVAEATSADGAVVDFPPPTVSEAVDPAPTVVFNPPSGTLFALGGPTLVTVTATDATGNESQTSFNVTVVDTTAPAITAPANVVVEAGAPPPIPVAIGTATATDAVDPAPVITNNAPGLFPLGLTVVTWRATDASGHYAEANQNVTVTAPADTTPPVVTPPGDKIAEATSAAGAVVVFPDATATDNVGVVSLVQTAGPASGSVFPIGTTDVVWTATDAAGNIGTATQKVTVVYLFGEFLPPLEDGKIYKANRTIPVKFRITFVGGEPAEEAVVQIQVVMIGEDETLGDPIDLSTSAAADTGSVFRFTDGQYIYNLSTRGFDPGMYRITAILSNGQAPFIDITLR